MSLKIKKTSKLYYKRWLYKLVIECGGISHLRRRGVEWVAATIPVTTAQGWNIKSYHQTVFENKDSLMRIGAVLETLLADVEHQIRVEGHTLAIFTNDTKLVDNVKNQLATFLTEVWEPNNLEEATFLLGNKTKIICDELPHENYRFKIYFKNGASPPKQFMDNFLSWSKKFDDGRIHIPKGTERILDGSTHNYFYGQYFYAKDSKITSMALMFMGDYMNKTEEYVLKSEIA